jgi:bifunctional non-homologous end joining protein LigD
VTSVEIEGRRLALTNLDKVLWPEAGLRKRDLLEYYLRVAPTLLRHLRGKPLTLRRFPDGVDGVSWHQNECRGEPEWFRVFETAGRRDRKLRFCMVEDIASLVWVVNQAAVELHPFLWEVEAPRRPIEVVFDLDPGSPADVVDCARVALALRDVLLELGLSSLVKTSGSLGLHVHIPLGSPHDAEHTKGFARLVARALEESRPDAIVAEMRKAERGGKVYIDWLQNDASRQTVAPYSLRGLPWPTVATPVAWAEVEEAAARRDRALLTFLHSDVVARLDEHADLFAAVNDVDQRLPEAGSINLSGR